MFRRRDNFVFQWTIPKQPAKNFWAELRKLDIRLLRLPAFGLITGFGIYIVVKLIVPAVEIPWLMGLVSALLMTLLLGSLFLAVSLETFQVNYGITDNIVSRLGNDGLRFSQCLACAVGPLETHFELVSRTGHVLRLELPRDETLRSQILEYVQARVKPWIHAELPSAMLAKALVLDEYLIAPYWIMTLLGNLLLAYCVSLYFPTNNGVSDAFKVAQFLLGTGWIWAWSGWSKLKHFPLRERVDMVFTLIWFTNGFSSIMYILFLGAFTIRRTLP